MKLETRRPPQTVSHTDPVQQAYRRARVRRWDQVAQRPRVGAWSGAYHRRLSRVYQSIVAPGQRVLEVGSGRGDLLAALRPSFGLGIDLSAEMVRVASERSPHLQFLQADVHTLALDETFDVVIMSDVVNDLWDVEAALHRLRRVMRQGSIIIVNFYSRVWELPLNVARRLGLAEPVLDQNWLTTEDVGNLMRLADLDVTRHWEEILLPVEAPPLDQLLNRYLARVWPFTHAALTNFMIARPVESPITSSIEPIVSVVVPARNEAGNIASIFERTPELGAGTELIFVEGHSTDDTYAIVEREIAKHPERSSRLLRQMGKGKGDAVRLGFEHARGDVLMILDADLTVAPEDLPRFYEALLSGKGDFINGVRLVYPMERQAMRFLNLLGNKFFSLAFSWLLGQSIKDTLCGTKVLRTADYWRIAENRAYFGDFDPFGDFDLLFGAARLNLKIVDLPIRYRERTYGATNISRWKHGWLLLRMTLFAARRIKFI
jgi:ubiquinone/menaquinone biosynthesis C-methylase UbiE